MLVLNKTSMKFNKLLFFLLVIIAYGLKHFYYEHGSTSYYFLKQFETQYKCNDFFTCIQTEALKLHFSCSQYFHTFSA